MKFFKLFTLLPLFFNGFLQMIGLSSIDNQQLEELKYTEIFKSEDLKAAFHGEETEEQIIWTIRLEQRTKDLKKQKVKLRILDHKQQSIPELAKQKIAGMTVKNDQLLENEFVAKVEKLITFKLPKKYAKLKIGIQLDEIKQVEKQVPLELATADQATDASPISNEPTQDSSSEEEEAELATTENSELMSDVLEDSSSEMSQSEVQNEQDNEAAQEELAEDQEPQEEPTQTIIVEDVVEDILAEPYNQAFQIEVKLRPDTSEQSIVEKVKEKIKEEVNDTFVPANQQAKEKQSVMSLRSAPRIYQNKVPDYVDNNTVGAYPSNFWEPSGQYNVRNHQGGTESVPGWDGLESWETYPDNWENSYIHYGKDQAGESSIALRKYATQTSENDLFNVRLNVKGNATKHEPIDVMFVLDVTQSMEYDNRRGNAATAFSTIIEKLKANQKDLDIRVGALLFADGTDVVEKPKEWVQYRQMPLTKDAEKWNTAVNAYSKRDEKYQGTLTFTQRALMEAKDMLLDGENRKKMLFLVTDGQPNCSYRPLGGVQTNQEILFDEYYIGKFDAKDSNGVYREQYKGNEAFLGGDTKFHRMGSSGPPNSYTFRDVDTGIDHSLTNHATTTLSAAWDLKEAGVEIHTLGIQIKGGEPMEYPTDRLKLSLAKIASRRNGKTSDSPSDYFYYDASQVGQIGKYFEDFYLHLVKTVQDGVITDPMGEFVELEGNLSNIQMKAFKNGSPTILNPKPVLAYDATTKTIKVSNLFLGEEEELQIDYKVRLQESHTDFVHGKWYQTNGQTTLEPKPETTNDKLDFGVPSVRLPAKKFLLPVRKVWQDEVDNVPDYWKLRPPEITIELQTQLANGWERLQEILLKPNDWQGTFYNIDAEDNQRFRIVEKVSDKDKVPGYAAPSYSLAEFTSSEVTDGKVVTVTNKLLTTDYEFRKYRSDGYTAFPTYNAPEFTLYDKAGNARIVNVAANNGGMVKFSGLPLGEYRIKETKVPEGHQAIADFWIVVTEDANGNLVAKAKDLPDPLRVTNELKKFELELTKKDIGNQQLAGATFKVTGPDGYTQTKNQGPVFTFTNLGPGEYFIEEVTTPAGFIGLFNPVRFTISKLGTVSLAGHELVTLDDTQIGSKNRILITVKNMPTGTLPEAGGKFGKFKLYAGMTFSLVIGLGVIYLIRLKRGEP